MSFDNTATAGAGYGPYVDLWLPATGTDGAGEEADDGLTFTSAVYRGTALDADVISVTDCADGGTHPADRRDRGLPAGIGGG